MVQCANCHPAAVYTPTEQKRNPKYDEARETTKDIMIPGVAICRECHTARSPNLHVRSDCVMCHVYHPSSTPGADQGALQPFLLDQILRPNQE